jgi:hypothetical protein
MAVTWISDSQASQLQSYPINTMPVLNVTKPTGVQAGDLLIAFAWGLEVQVSAAPSGFTLIGSQSATQLGQNFYYVAVSVWYKVATGAEPGSYGWTPTQTGTSPGQEWEFSVDMTCYRGANQNPRLGENVGINQGSHDPGTQQQIFTENNSAANKRPSVLIWTCSGVGLNESTGLPDGMNLRSNYAYTHQQVKIADQLLYPRVPVTKSWSQNGYGSTWVSIMFYLTEAAFSGYVSD